MNKRIRQLAEQAGAVFEQTNGLNDCPQDSLVGDEIEKFAELIVAECARIARATPCPYEQDEVRQRLGHTWDMASLEAGREIVKHFGVGE
jgi:hypothetical protein